MPIPSNDDRFINSVLSQIAKRCVALHMRTWRLRTRPKNTWKTATTQIMPRRWGEKHNTWNALLEAPTLPGSSPVIQQSLQDKEVCRVALSCHFALDVLYMSMEW